MTTTYLPLEGKARRHTWFTEKMLLGQSFPAYLRSLVTPFNAVASVIVLVGLWIAITRFTVGLAATTNLTDLYPWGLWIGFDVLVGVATAAGGYTLASTVYIFRLKEYHPLVRPAVLTGFLGYFFVVVGLLFDLGRPWRLPFPIFVSFGVTSIMFLVAWHVLLYLTCQFVEFCPALFEWLGWRKVRAWAVRLTFAATIFGVMLSTLHQSALGGLFLLTPSKLHPLWYSPLLPVFFFISSIFTGLAMVIVESTLSHRIFTKQVGASGHHDVDGLIRGLGKAAAVVMFTYCGLKVIGLMHADGWGLLGTPLGQWFMVEVIGFVLLPANLFALGARNHSTGMVKLAAVLAVVGIAINRINVSIIAFNWQEAERYVPRWTEFAITIAIITVAVLSFRWIVNRMPVLFDHPEYEAEE